MPPSSRINQVPVESLINIQREDGTHDRDHKVSEIKDEKMPNASIFTFIKEDHTMGNMLRTQLHTHKEVSFCGYKPDHPTVHTFFLKLQTDPSTTPAASCSRGLRELLFTVRTFGVLFEDAIRDHDDDQWTRHTGDADMAVDKAESETKSVASEDPAVL
ncbi:putative DNA-directed RNA polymerase II subunit RPB11 [Diplonema papillatum]|nr:putative DNA-directed RNA polymerase II subunit RPB11 [Diplonema papillatum]